MIYDEGKNYIGDHHYGQAEFEEGVELRLDRGVLVDVGERLGETQTDLTSILDRKKDDSSPQPARNIRLVAAASQRDLKPLSQILGTQPRLGRARLLPSPYQQRHALVPVQPAEASMPPPPKRQRIDVSEQENRPPIAQQIEKLALKPFQRVLPKHLTPQPVRRKDAVVDFQDVLDLSSDEEVAKSAKKKAPQAKKNLAKKKTSAQGASKSREKAHSDEKMTRRAPQKQSETNRRIAAPETVPSPKEPTRRQQPRPHGSSTCSKISQPSTSSRSGMTQLLLRSPKPRRKLMYRALLPSSKPPQRPDGAPSPRETRSPSPSLPAAAGSECTDISQGEDSPPEGHPAARRGSNDAPLDVPSSPLFVPEDQPPKSPNSSPRLSQDSLEARLLDRLDTPERHSDVQKDSPRTSARNSPAISDAERDGSGPAGLPNPFPLSQRQMLPPPPPGAAQLQTACTPTPRQRTFRRVRSENDASLEAEEDFPDLDGFSVPPPSFLAKAKAKASPTCVFRAPSRSPAKLRRTASDSAVMDDSEKRAVGYNIEPIQEEVGETGPWTTAEAFLLFEWWPAGKAKPDHGVPVNTEVNIGQCGPGRVPITTARDMLRDEINVL